MFTWDTVLIAANQKGPPAGAIALLLTAPIDVEAGTLAQIATSTRQTRPSTASNAKLRNRSNHNLKCRLSFHV